MSLGRTYLDRQAGARSLRLLGAMFGASHVSSEVRGRSNLLFLNHIRCCSPKPKTICSSTGLKKGGARSRGLCIESSLQLPSQPGRLQ